MDEIDEKRKKRYKEIGITILWVALIICIIIFLLLRFDSVWEGIREVLDVLTPFVVGIALCFLVNPVYNHISDWINQKTGHRKTGKIVASVASVILVLLLIYGAAALLMPRLIESVKNLYEKTPEMAANFLAWYASLENREFPLKQQILDAIQSIINYSQDFVNSTITPNLNVIASKLFDSVLSVAGIFYDFIIGLIAMVYLLNYKEKLIPAAKRALYSLIPAHADDLCIKAKRFSEIFGGFIFGKILDSIIIGFLCFIGMEILRMPYALLISVIVGVTNVIPFFGPLIGAIPGAFIIFMTSPEKGLLFILFILVLQQFDGNILGPKILGDSIGISSLSVLFSIIVGGGLFGFAGMLLAVPTWAFIEYLVSEKQEERLKKSGLPVEIEAYGPGKHPVPKQEEKDEKNAEGDLCVSVAVTAEKRSETEETADTEETGAVEREQLS